MIAGDITVNVGDVVAYDDAANPWREFTVVAIDTTNPWNPYTLRTDDGDVRIGTINGPRWFFVRTAQEGTR